MMNEKITVSEDFLFKLSTTAHKISMELLKRLIEKGESNMTQVFNPFGLHCTPPCGLIFHKHTVEEWRRQIESGDAYLNLDDRNLMMKLAEIILDDIHGKDNWEIAP